MDLLGTVIGIVLIGMVIWGFISILEEMRRVSNKNNTKEE